MELCFCKIIFALTLTCVCVFGYNLNVESALTFKDPSAPKSRGSYFGFTVVLVNTTHSGSWLLVGAPRANSTGENHRDIVEPGVLFKCCVNNKNQTCEQYILDKKGNGIKTQRKGIKYYERKDGAWIGGAMDIYSSGDDAEVIICGPRWVIQDTTVDDELKFSMLGICYVIHAMDINKPVNVGGTKTIMVPNIHELTYEEANGGLVYYYEFAQAGLSVHYAVPPNKETVLVTGVPGVLNWQGGLLYANRKCQNDTVPQQRRRRDVETCQLSDRQNITTVLSGHVVDFSLFGYQVNSGNFFSGTYSYVASSPRGSNMTGNVLLFSIEPVFKRQLRLKGTRTGEYFGASIAVADINGDHLHDLIVGAPMFDEKCEEGRIYVYYGSREKNYLKRGEPVNGYYEKSRFGTAITSLGDIDQDGYEDIAVGAPYEENGVVYIFSGSYKGLRKDYSQRIVAKDSWPNLKGFGISISKPSDIDNNYYNDIAVGSFLSGNAVVLRSHPVAKLCMSLTSNTKFLLLNASSFTVQLDLWFEGQYVYELDVAFNVTVDKKYKHGYISTASAGQRDVTYKQTVTLQSGKNYTEILTVHLDKNKHESRNQVSQTMIVMEASLYKKDGAETVNGGDFQTLLPILHKYDSIKSTFLSIPISHGCGKNICYCDLELTTNLKPLSNNGVFVTGSVNVLDLEVTVLNKADTTYQTAVCIILPYPVQLDRIPKNCYESQIGLLNTINITCDVAYVLRQGMNDSFTVHLDMTHATNDFNISISVSSLIDDEDLSNNFETKMLKLVTEADVTIAGKDENPQHDYKGNYPKTAQITHKYEVQKFKDSSVDEVEVTLNVPWLYYVEGQKEPIRLLEIYEPETSQNDKYYYDKLKCYYNIPEFKQGMLDESTFDEELLENKHSVGESSVDISKQKHKLTTINSVVYLNCTNSSNNTKCRYIKCLTRPFTQKNMIARITLTMEINIADLAPYVGKNGEIRFSTDGSVNITKPAMLQHDGVNNLTDYATATAVFNLYTQPEEVETKIYIIAIIVGLLLLLLLLLGLIKVGFFRRKKQEEMKKKLLEENATAAPNVEENGDKYVSHSPEA